MKSKDDLPLSELTSVPDGSTNIGFVPDGLQDCIPHDAPERTLQPVCDGDSPETRWRRYLRPALIVAMLLGYNAYLAAGIVLTWRSAKDYCHDVKLLTVVTGVVYTCIVVKMLLHLWRCRLQGRSEDLKEGLLCGWMREKRHWIRNGCWMVSWGAVLGFLVYDCIDDAQRLMSIAGAVVLILIGYAFSKHRRHINWYQVMWAMMLQFILGLLALRWDVGRVVFMCLGNKVQTFLDYTSAGSHFVFGHLASGIDLKKALGSSQPESENLTVIQNTTDVIRAQLLSTVVDVSPVFVFIALPTIFFFSFFVSILYYTGVMQALVLNAGWFLQVTIGTTVCESITAAANVFLGMTEAPLMIRPFLPVMTNSELHAVMTGGFATIAGSVMAAYISMGVSASHLLTASIMSAPAALAFSKLFYPEVEESKTLATNIQMPKSEENNVLEAACNGTMVALTMIGYIVANLVAFLAFLAFLNGTLLWFGGIVQLDFLTFEWLLGQLLRPLAFMMGVSWNDSGAVGELLGIKTFANEFVAYAHLSRIRSQLEARSVVISTYALCGFSNVGSVGIVLGGLGALCPDRKKDLADMALRALVAGSAACFITACIAGSLIS